MFKLHRKYLIWTAIPLAVSSTNVLAATITDLRVTAGTFSMGVFTPAPNTITNFNGTNLIGSYSAPGWDTNTAQSAAAPSAIAAFNFNGGGVWVNTYTAAAATQSGVAGGGPAPSGTVGGGNSTIANGDAITVDLSSFFANWNGTDFSQGTSSLQPATGTVSNVSGNSFTYTLHWTSKIVGGPFNNQTGTWTFTGTGKVAAATTPNNPASDAGTVDPLAPFSTVAITGSQLNTYYPADSTMAQQCVGGCFAFQINSLTKTPANVVLPLSAPIPANAVYRKITSTTGTWANFDTSKGDAVASAPLDKNTGICPTPGNSAYQAGLTQGDLCVQLTIADGGPNDADGATNSSITDPGGIAVPASTSAGSTLVPMTSKSGCAIDPTANNPWGSADWWIVGAFLAYLDVRRRRARRARSAG